MKNCLHTINKLKEDYGLSKSEIQWITGLETFKGVDLETLEKAAGDILEYCENKKVLQESP
jgi:hypothetical protein